MPAKATKTAPSRRNRPSRPEVQQEFQTIRREVEAAQESASPKVAEAEERHAAEVRGLVHETSVESISEEIYSLGAQISRTLAELRDGLEAEVSKLASVKEAVELERQELTRLHKIDVVATSIDQLLQDYERERERLETEIQMRRSEWEQEAKAAERERKEADETLRKQRQRENDDFEYKKQVERKKAQDKYEEEIRLLDKKNIERQQELEHNWAQREAALKDREDELAKLRRETEELPKRVDEAKQAALAEATKQAAAMYEQRILILQKDSEAERKVAELQVRTLQESLNRQTEQVAALEKALEEAKRQVQEIALKAIEGASGSRALAHVNQIAMEQAKSRPQS